MFLTCFLYLQTSNQFILGIYHNISTINHLFKYCNYSYSDFPRLKLKCQSKIVCNNGNFDIAIAKTGTAMHF